MLIASSFHSLGNLPSKMSKENGIPHEMSLNSELFSPGPSFWNWEIPSCYSISLLKHYINWNWKYWKYWILYWYKQAVPGKTAGSDSDLLRKSCHSNSQSQWLCNSSNIFFIKLPCILLSSITWEYLGYSISWNKIARD